MIALLIRIDITSAVFKPNDWLRRYARQIVAHRLATVATQSFCSIHRLATVATSLHSPDRGPPAGEGSYVALLLVLEPPSSSNQELVLTAVRCFSILWLKFD